MSVLEASKATQYLKDYKSKDGLDIHTLIDSSNFGGLTYNDFLILPSLITFPASQVNLETKLTKKITLKSPFLSAPMDTVTEENMAIHMSLLGGIGIIHHNCSAEEQAEMVKKVKKYENGFINDPVVIDPSTTVAQVKKFKSLLGFTSFPVTGMYMFSRVLLIDLDDISSSLTLLMIISIFLINFRSTDLTSNDVGDKLIH